MNQTVVQKAKFLLPNAQVDYGCWAVVACDQFTSQIAYWQEVEARVGDKPSTYHMILPEAYLGTEKEKKQGEIPKTMQKYLEEGVFQEKEGFIYVRRTLLDGSVRKGLLAKVDLEAYDFTPGNHALIRATEKTVLERIPPRVQIRRAASLELPHVLLLLCDETRTVLESLEDDYEKMEKLYDFSLMQEGGRIEGYLFDEHPNFTQALLALFEKKGDTDPFLLVGDGNHSLASAKALWEEIRPALSLEERKTHPARFALVEITNLYDDSLQFEPIYRVAFHVKDPMDLAQSFADYLKENEGGEGSASFRVCYPGGYAEISTDAMPTPIEVETVDRFLTLYKEENPELTVDYVHGYADAVALSDQEQVVALITAPFAKEALPWYIASYGVLPKKTFSMGQAREKRYYLECRKIVK